MSSIAATTETSFDPRTGGVLHEVAITPPDQVRSVAAAAARAASQVAATTPDQRSRWLDAIADALEASADELVTLADAETALGAERLTGELARAAAQLRFYGRVAVEGSWLGVAIDREAGLHRMAVPLGPVAVFGASNFPFAFGVLGNDTASAVAAGCPVVVKAHPAHVGLSARLAEVATKALADAGAPDGVFSLVVGMEAGTALVQADQIAAVAFTGSQQGGLALWRLANERQRVIPVFAEMGTINPVVMTRAAPVAEVAAGFVASFTQGAGQYCTKPGLLLAPAGRGVPAAVASALTAASPRGWALTSAIAANFARGVEDLVAAGASALASVDGPDSGWSVTATALSVPLPLLRRGSRLLEECFGPVALVAEYDDLTAVRDVLVELPGALAASVMTGGPDDSCVAELLAALSQRVGRVAVDQWPTGVAWTWAQQHGGPWPATSAPASTSVGAGALTRFVRPVTWQNVPDAALPPALQEANPWRLPRRVDGVLE